MISRLNHLSYPLSFFLLLVVFTYLLSLLLPLVLIYIIDLILAILIYTIFKHQWSRLQCVAILSWWISAVFYAFYLISSSQIQKEEMPIYDDFEHGLRMNQRQFFLYEATLEHREFKKDHWRLYWRLGDDVKVYSRWTESIDALSSGSQYYLYAQFIPFESPLNPSDFDLRENAIRKGLSYQAKIKSLYLKQKTWYFEIEQALIDFNLMLRKQWSQFGRGGDLYNGLIFGDYALAPQDRNAFNQTGIAHLLSVSGFHVTLISWFFMKFLDFCLVYGFSVIQPRKWSIGLSLIMIWVFIGMAQSPICAQRAGYMLSFALIAQFFFKKINAIECCSLSALLLLNPIDLFFDISLQLSFVAVYALLIFQSKSQNLFTQLIIVSTTAFLATAPLQAYHFGTCSLYAILFNCILTPIGGLIIMPLGLIALFLSPFTQVPMYWAAFLGEKWIDFTIFCAQITQGEKIVGSAFAWILASISIIIVILIAPSIKPIPRLSLCMLILIFGIYKYQDQKPKPNGITWIAVGQGNATLLKGDQGFSLIDTGPRSNSFQLISFLKKSGIQRLDWVLISHWHPDHDGGLWDLLENGFEIGEIKYHGGRFLGENRDRLKQLLKDKGIAFKAVKKGSFDWDGLYLNFLWGSDETRREVLKDPDIGENDLSIPLIIELKNKGRILLSGDLERYGESKLIASLERLSPSLDQLPIKLFQLNHHGSKTSSHPLLLKTLNCRYAVVSLGKNHHFNFPHPEVILHLKETRLLRTDQGMIAIDFDRIPID
jgi:competence protein ComEC